MLGLGGIQVFSSHSVIVYNYEKVRELFPFVVFGHMPNRERQDLKDLNVFIFHLPLDSVWLILYLYILVDSIWSFKIVYFLFYSHYIGIGLKNNSLWDEQRCSKVKYQNPGICVSSQAAVAPHLKTLTGLLNHPQPYGRRIIGCLCSHGFPLWRRIRSVHWQSCVDQSAIAWKFVMKSMLCKYDWRCP